MYQLFTSSHCLSPWEGLVGLVGAPLLDTCWLIRSLVDWEVQELHAADILRRLAQQSSPLDQRATLLAHPAPLLVCTYPSPAVSASALRPHWRWASEQHLACFCLVPLPPSRAPDHLLLFPHRIPSFDFDFDISFSRHLDIRSIVRDRSETFDALTPLSLASSSLNAESTVTSNLAPQSERPSQPAQQHPLPHCTHPFTISIEGFLQN